ncbi:FadR/GntR family transcriptional regulator [Bacillus sp. V2I10]|uniref:FadR/GntR family transcriptional regulator n=1 Tax=Bacillus sp. V2I10 TaxID=3042276 RepID=UPI00278582B1|nr:GntR family transcriptional regulator [Bacillus sp. V2I10]MDQ0858105.1 GntR family transcriptional repressor for pyruvate dehydrogenase complex [Bacillus sp. V2I10]
MTEPKSKVYIEILRQIRSIIHKDGLSAGDKIPSERELAELLNAGRSSVREALRALELLGMIETRRGEGTYIKDFREHGLVEILGTFILQDKNAIADLIEMNVLLESNALKLLLEKDNNEEELKNLAIAIQEQNLGHMDIMAKFMQLSDNYLLLRIWSVLNEYLKVIQTDHHSGSAIVYEKIIDGLASKDEKMVFESFYTLTNKKNASALVSSDRQKKL